jgi:glyoxylase-like metal-dependent hydrolase (beta-lactamase superfamily II)
MLQVSPVRAFSDNYIWLIRAPADPAAAVVVDPGDDRPVEQALQAQGLQLGAILVTHHHADHVGMALRYSDRRARRCPARCRPWTMEARLHLRTSGSNSTC